MNERDLEIIIDNRNLQLGQLGALLERSALGIRLLADTWAHFGGEFIHSNHCWKRTESVGWNGRDAVLECECGLFDLEEAIETLCKIASDANA